MSGDKPSPSGSRKPGLTKRRGRICKPGTILVARQIPGGSLFLLYSVKGLDMIRELKLCSAQPHMLSTMLSIGA